jgi:hypothetical protein
MKYTIKKQYDYYLVNMWDKSRLVQCIGCETLKQAEEVLLDMKRR